MDLFLSFFNLFFCLALYVLGDHEDTSGDAASSSSQDSKSETSISHEYSASSSSSSMASNVEGASPLNHSVVFDPLLERGAGKSTPFTPLNSAALKTVKAARIDPAAVGSFLPVLIPIFQPNNGVFDSPKAAMVQSVEPASSDLVDPTASTVDESESHLSVVPADESERKVSAAHLSLDLAGKMMMKKSDDLAS